MPEIERPGIFKAQATSTQILRASKSKAVGIKIHVNLLEMLNPQNEWEEWAQYEYTASGGIWIVGKLGNVINANVEKFIRIWNWDAASILDFENGNLTQPKLQVTIKIDRHGKNFEIDWIEPYEGGGSGGGGGDASDIDAMYGGQFRALRGNLLRNDTPTEAELVKEEALLAQTMPGAQSASPTQPPPPMQPAPAPAKDDPIPF